MSVGFNHDGAKIVSGSLDGTIRVWNAHTGKCISTLEYKPMEILSVGFNYDGTKIVSIAALKYSFPPVSEKWPKILIKDKTIRVLELQKNKKESKKKSKSKNKK